MCEIASRATLGTRWHPVQVCPDAFWAFKKGTLKELPVLREEYPSSKLGRWRDEEVVREGNRRRL